MTITILWNIMSPTKIRNCWKVTSNHNIFSHSIGEMCRCRRCFREFWESCHLMNNAPNLFLVFHCNWETNQMMMTLLTIYIYSKHCSLSPKMNQIGMCINHKNESLSCTFRMFHQCEIAGGGEGATVLLANTLSISRLGMRNSLCLFACLF